MMDKRIIIVALVAVVAVVGVAAFALATGGNGGGGSGGSGEKTVDHITETVTESEITVDTASFTEKLETFSETAANKMYTFESTTTVSDSLSLTLAKSAASAAAGKDVSIQVTSVAGSFTVSYAGLKTLADAVADGDNLTLSFELLDSDEKSALPSHIAETVTNLPVYSIENSAGVHDLQGIVTLGCPYTFDDTVIVKAYYLDTDADEFEKILTKSINYTSKVTVFESAHMSYFTLSDVLIDDEGEEYKGEGMSIDDAYGRIYGNPDGDTQIDSTDLEIIEAIYDGATTLAKYPLADSNMDGTIDVKDYYMVQQFINGEDVEINVIDVNGDIGKINCPVTGIFITGGTNMRVVIQVLDMEPYLVANATNDYISPTLDKTLYDLREDGTITKVTTSATSADWSKLISRAGNFSLAVLENSGMSGYASEKGRATFSDWGVDVLQFTVDNYEQLKRSVGTLGILVDSSEQATSFIDMLDYTVETIETSLGEKFGTATVMDVVMSNSVSGTSGDYYDLTLLAGGNNLADWTESTRKFDPATDTWLYEERYNPDYLFHFKSMTYGADISKTEISNYVHYFDKTKAYLNERYYLINGAIPMPVRMAYMAGIMYSDVFEADWYLELFQDYVDKFAENESLVVSDIKVTWTTPELKELLG